MKNGGFPMKNGGFPMKNGGFPMKNGDLTNLTMKNGGLTCEKWKFNHRNRFIGGTYHFVRPM